MRLSSSLQSSLDAVPRYIDVRLPEPVRGAMADLRPLALSSELEEDKMEVRVTGGLRLIATSHAFFSS